MIGRPQLIAQRRVEAKVMVGAEEQIGERTKMAYPLRVAASDATIVGVMVDSRYIIGIDMTA